MFTRLTTGLVARFGSLPYRQLRRARGPVLPVAAEDRRPHQHVTGEQR